jgi:ankyrin repeat protein
MESPQTLENDSSRDSHDHNDSLLLVSMALPSSPNGQSQACSSSSLKRKHDEVEEEGVKKVHISNRLCQAAMKGLLPTVKMLHERGYPLNCCETEDINHPYYNMTPLAFALLMGNDHVVRYLLIHGADPNLPFRKDNTTLLMYALRRGVYILEDGKIDEHEADYFYYLCEFLLKKGANVNAVDIYGFTGLHHIYYLYNAQPLCGNFSRFIKLLVKYGADETIKNKKEESVVDLHNRTTHNRTTLFTSSALLI